MMARHAVSTPGVCRFVARPNSPVAFFFWTRVVVSYRDATVSIALNCRATLSVFWWRVVELCASPLVALTVARTGMTMYFGIGNVASLFRCR